MWGLNLDGGSYKVYLQNVIIVIGKERERPPAPNVFFKFLLTINYLS
jgi:hypothetical protein